MKLALPLLALVPVLAIADDPSPIATDRPGFSDGSSVVGRGRTQIESGFFRTMQGRDTTTTLPDMLLRHGLTEDFELRLVGLTYGFAPQDTQGWLDPSVGFKIRLQRPSGKRGELTLEGQTTFPVGESALRSNTWNPTFKLLATTPVGANALGSNLVWTRIGPDGAKFDQTALSVYYAVPLNGRTGLTYKVWGVDHFAAGESSAFFGSVAITYLSNSNTQWDLRVGSGLNQSRDGWFVQGGYSVRF